MSGVWVYIIQLFCYYQMFKVKPCSASNGGMQTLSALNQMAKVCPDFVDVKTHRKMEGNEYSCVVWCVRVCVSACWGGGGVEKEREKEG